MRFLRMIAPVLGIKLSVARDLARSVLVRDEPDDPRGDDSQPVRPRQRSPSNCGTCWWMVRKHCL
jgi:hypothetical protein